MNTSLVNAKQVELEKSVVFINMNYIENYINELYSKEVIIQVNEDSIACKVRDLGISIYEQSIINKWAIIQFNNNLHNQLKKINLFTNGLFGTIHINYDISFNNEIMETYLKESLKGFNKPAKNANVVKVNEGFKYEEEVIGQAIVLNATIERLHQSFNNWNGRNITVAAVVSKVVPKLTLPKLEASKDLLGTFTTYYTEGSERENNLTNGGEFIDGYILYPGEIFSIYSLLAPITFENGYVMASAFSNKEIIRDIGGGICQLSSTLYNAVLESELDIIERHEHSIQVGYIDVSRDATVTSKYKDFRFKNSTSSIIYIECLVLDGRVTISIYGEEYRDINSRKIEFEVVKKRYIAPNIIKITADKEEQMEQEGRYGCEAELYKVVYVNGIERERVLINSSKYAPVEIRSIVE